MRFSLGVVFDLVLLSTLHSNAYLDRTRTREAIFVL